MNPNRLETSQIFEAIESDLNKVHANDRNFIPQELHRHRSKLWVKHFALELCKQYDNKSIVAFYRDKLSREILFDITIGYQKEFKTNRSKPSFNYIINPLWQIESEFALSASNVAFDFTKLISGSAPFKMMIGSLNPKVDQKYFMNAMKVIAPEIKADELYYLLLSHPNPWDNVKKVRLFLYQWSNNNWSEIEKGT